MMGKKRGRKPGFTFAKPTSSPSTPLANDYGPSAFVSGELPTNNGAKTGPKFGPRITSLEEEMDLFQEKIDGLGYEHKVLMAEINIINDFIKERFGVQLINQDSQILKLLQLSDGVQDLSKALALPRTKQAQSTQIQRPAASRRNMQPYLPAEDILDYDDDYAEQVADDPYNQFGQYNNYGSSRKNIGYLRDTKITKYKMIDMQLAPNQPLEIEQSGDEEEEMVMEEEMMDDMEGTGEQEEEQADFQGEDENYDNEQKEEGDYDEVDGEQETEEAEPSLDVKENGVTDEEKYPAPPPLIPGKALSSEVMKEDCEEGEDEAEQPMDDEDDEQTEEGTEATEEDKVKDEPEDEDDVAADANTPETETDPEAAASRSRSEEQEPSPTRSNSRTRTRVAKAPKRYRDEDEPVVKHSKPKPPKQRMITTPKTPLTKPTPTTPIQQSRKSIPAQQPAVQQKQPTTLRFNCMFPDCGKYFPTKDQLTKHHQLHKSKPATLTQEDIEKLTCEYCSKIFSSTWNLKTHYRTHTGEKPYPCNYCGQRFAYNQSRELHERHNHTLERPYVCNYCGKSFCASGELGSHLGRVHQRSYQENKEQLMEMEKYEDVDQEEDDDDGPPQLIRSAPMPSVPKRGRPPGRGGQQQQRGDFGSHFLCYD